MLSVLILCSGAEWAWYVMRSTGEGAPSSRLSVPFPAQSHACQGSATTERWRTLRWNILLCSHLLQFESLRSWVKWVLHHGEIRWGCR